MGAWGLALGGTERREELLINGPPTEVAFKETMFLNVSGQVPRAVK